MPAGWKLTVRSRARVEHERFESLDAAMAAMTAHVDALRGGSPRRTERVLGREYDPVRQVAGRVEVGRGRALFGGAHGGVDVRGDGSVEAWVGLVRKRLLEPDAGEDAVSALRRALADGR